MAKAIKTKKRRLKKTVRKTLGTLFLVSAIIVAAIPVENLRAAEQPPEITVDIKSCNIPYIENPNETIYTTGDGQYQFAYVSPKNASSNNKVAVILGYNGGYLEGGALKIPDTVDAYLKFSDNLGTSSGYAAVGKQGNFLFYAMEEPVRDNQGNIIYDSIPREDSMGNPVLDEDGNQIIDEVKRTITVYHPCYYEDRSNWEKLDVTEFYYEAGTSSGGEPVYEKTTTSDMQRIQGAEVWYIGNQYLKEGTEQGTWTIAGDITDSTKGIFSGQGNIKTLTVGQKLSGIGVYAFFGCSGLNSISLGNGLDTIANYAFANCINMGTINLDMYSRVDIIGDHAFYNCQALQGFTVPISVTKIGDSAFEECYAMEYIDLVGGGEANVSLTDIGQNVFKNCANLQGLTFPRTFTNNGQAIDITNFRGCTSLKYIATSNNLIRFAAEDPNYTFADLKQTLPKEFYFEGLENSPVHLMATANYFAFSYLNKDLYEITVDENGKKAVYRVNSQDQLVYCQFDSGLDTVTLPGAIGPHKIVIIDSGTFQNNCYLKKITIPSSISSIAENAFRGCHNLENVIFKEPVNLTYIGDGAFKTQEVSYHMDDCANQTLPMKPVLKFTGPVSGSCVPFMYAMESANYINSGSQERTYITYYSGWPTNLEVQYNHNTDKNELVDYPTFKEIASGVKYVVGDTYQYMTKEYEDAAKSAVGKYTSQEPMTDYEKQIIDAALNIVLPDGVESIKTGLFAQKENDESTGVEKTITAYSLNEIAGAKRDEYGAVTAGGEFKDCKNLKGIYLMGNTTSIGDYAFEGCDKLVDVSIPTTVTQMGVRPFKDCDKLSYVNFQGSPNFSCEESIIYQLDEEGNKQKVVEFLLSRETGVVSAEELAGVSEIAPEAFADTQVSSVDFRDSQIIEVPENAFAGTSKLFSIYLPDTCKAISKDSFKDSSVSYLEIPGSVNYLDNEAFSGTTNKNGMQFYCEDNSNAYVYAKKHGIKTTSKPIETAYTVTFWDWDTTLLDTQVVSAGEDAVPPEVPGRPGYIHTGWVPDYHGVNTDLQITAQYEAEDPDAHKFKVSFLDWDDTELKTMLVAPGADAEPPFDPKREGYRFTGWRPEITNIQEDTVIYAQYEKIDSEDTKYVVRFIDYDDTVLYTQKVNPGEDAIAPQAPSREGYQFTGWRPAITAVEKDLDTYAQYEKLDNTNKPGDGDNNGGNNGDNNGGNNGDNNGGNNGGNNGDNNGGNNGDNNGDNNKPTSKFYTLTVRNGSGSGSYAAGTQPIIVANDPAAGQEFARWTIEPAGTPIASIALSATVITMPEGNVTVTATYKAKSTSGGSGSDQTGSSNSSGSNNRPNNNTPGGKGGTTVVIDKNGLSNTGVVTATVNGSSDNFTIKISESTEASEAAVKALMAEYGDLSNIKYFPMDISLYDSTGNKKIKDTSGLSVRITLPLPDSLITYAGNNKAAAIANDKMDKLNAKFTTISGVSCITFTAEHFSPYVIYVDTDNLTAGVINDDTPKTGDGIHPKWFLSMGLACLSFVFFMKRDKQTAKKVKAKARA